MEPTIECIFEVRPKSDVESLRAEAVTDTDAYPEMTEYAERTPWGTLHVGLRTDLAARFNSGDLVRLTISRYEPGD